MIIVGPSQGNDQELWVKIILPSDAPIPSSTTINGIYFSNIIFNDPQLSKDIDDVVFGVPEKATSDYIPSYP